MNSSPLDEQTLARMDRHGVPPGFEPMRMRVGFVRLCDSVYVDYQRQVLGARILPEHLNPLGIAHGGMLATLADTAFGTVIKLNSSSPLPPATINLSLDYISPAHEGAWIEAHVQVHKLGRRLSNASCSLMDGERLVARGTATFVSGTQSLHSRS
ncbi:PaaI family thioesterase [Pseudomonas sp. NPDC089569]|uniref:PaaI family thioesterase n=1 Tax=Pseudomonas sp. NPDC089569 TaxID=3390722 RepID=UPI003D0675A8